MTKITAFFYILFHSFLVIQAQENKLENLLKEINPQGFTGFELYDSDTNKVLYSHHSDQYFIPASNVKIYTLAATFPHVKDSIISAIYYPKKDTLLLYPMADPTFLDNRFSSTRLLDILNKKEYQTLGIDLSYTIDAYAPGWSWDDYDQSYMPERSILPLFGNLFQEKLQQHFSTSYTKEKRNFHSNHFNLEKDRIPFIVSDSIVINLLKDISGKEVYIDHSRAFDSLPIDSLHWVFSNPKKSVYQEMMLESDNFIAEQIWFNTSLSVGISIENLRSFLNHQLSIEPKIVDGSGLSRYNLLRPNQFVLLLNHIKNNIPYYLEYFPENGISGTLKNSYLKEKSYIFAKTGSMSGVYNLSGYLKTNSGKILIFSLMNNNFIEKGSNLKPRIEALLLYIKHHY